MKSRGRYCIYFCLKCFGDALGHALLFMQARFLRLYLIGLGILTTARLVWLLLRS